jgi:hypothetical protein
MSAFSPEACLASFEGARAIAESARSATSGWRAICVRERRRLGATFIEPLSTLDLDEDVASIARAVRAAARGSDVDTLVFGLFDAIDDGNSAHAGYHVAGVASRGRTAEELIHDPWTPARRFLRSESLDAIVSVAARAPRHVRSLLQRSLSFPAAMLMGRFAARGLPHRVIVAFDDDDDDAPRTTSPLPRFAEVVRSCRPPAAAPSFAAALPRLVQAC